MQIHRPAPVPLLLFKASLLAVLCCLNLSAAAPKVHVVALGAVRKVPYTPPEASLDKTSEEATTLRVRPLFVDDRQKEWTVGELHDVTDRSFVIRRALHINDALPGEASRWKWQPGPWLMVDRISGRITALHLPAFDPQVSEVVWFRDYAAYCGIAPTVRNGGLVAVVAEIGGRKPVVQKVLGPWPQTSFPACMRSVWQRTPIRVSMQANGGEAYTFDVLGTSSLIEEGESSEEPQ